MCRSQADGGRRCPNSSRAGSGGPPADGKTRIAVVTSKRSYSVIGGDSRVTWLPGEKVESIDVIEPGQRPAAGHGGDSGRRGKWRYCNCAGSHKPGCPNAGLPDALPPLAEDETEGQPA